MPQTAEALRLEFVIAESYLKGEKRRWMGLRLLSGKNDAVQILDEISTNYPDSRLAELAIKATADHMFDSGDHKLAEGEYARLLREYPRSRYTEHAMSRSAEAALASYGGVAYDEAQLIEAEERFEDFRRYSPAAADRKGVGAILDSIRESRGEKDFSVAAYYDRTRHFSSAIYYYRLVRRDWPGTIADVKAAERLNLLGAPVTRGQTGAAGS
ncbi:MAG: outer membrane protein assembly factor BamD [Planctomycetes bacterium]|nr:outer membrane protein assembly factor BamD [Planctomycetota bacterium]